MTTTYVSYLERGLNPSGMANTLLPTTELADAIASALQLSPTEIRCAAGLNPPDDIEASCEATGDGFDESDFAVLYRRYMKLDSKQRERFRPVLDMLEHELERLGKPHS